MILADVFEPRRQSLQIVDNTTKVPQVQRFFFNASSCEQPAAPEEDAVHVAVLGRGAATAALSTSVSLQCGGAPAAAQRLHLLSGDLSSVFQCTNLVRNLGIMWICQRVISRESFEFSQQ